ncbi:MAG TPA: hypothetical protein VGP82_03930 [Ktedonobacterales bacterium]|nr:hypothetical protein [Ktedonobacterales bacterium]
MPTARAILTRVRGVHRPVSPAGPCGLAGEEVRDLGPRRVMKARGEGMVLHHGPHRQILDRAESILVDQAATLLRGAGAAPPADALSL